MCLDSNEPDATTLIDNQYSYNDANNITSWTNASGNHTYGYDLVDRLASATNRCYCSNKGEGL